MLNFPLPTEVVSPFAVIVPAVVLASVSEEVAVEANWYSPMTAAWAGPNASSRKAQTTTRKQSLVDRK